MTGKTFPTPSPRGRVPHLRQDLSLRLTLRIVSNPFTAGQSSSSIRLPIQGRRFLAFPTPSPRGRFPHPTVPEGSGWAALSFQPLHRGAEFLIKMVAPVSNARYEVSNPFTAGQSSSFRLSGRGL